MTIKDIAKAAGVSVATVSRIMNHKDNNISPETRNRVLQVIQDSGYVPYAKLRDRLMTATNAISLIIPTLEPSYYARFVAQIQHLIREQGYTLTLTVTGGDLSAEMLALENCRSSKVAGILFFPGTKEGLSKLAQLHSEGLHAVILDHVAEDAVFPQVFRVQDRIAKCCTEYLIESCQYLGLITRKACGSLSDQTIRTGFEAALLEANRLIDRSTHIHADSDFERELDALIEKGVNGIVCQDAEIAGLVYTAAEKKCLQIPKDLSVISMESGPVAIQLKPALSTLCTDPTDMAGAAVEALLWQIQHTTPGFTSQTIYSKPYIRSSIAVREKYLPKIVIIGSMNIDMMIQVPHLPSAGETVLSQKLTVLPGGKGANQALGVSRMGGSAHLVGCLGNDRHGKQLMEQMIAANVSMSGVTLTSEAPTGTAYIHVCKSGNNTIVVHPGANSLVDYEYICRHHALLRSADYCLVQMEIPFEAVRETIRYCNAHNVHTILKPSPARQIPSELLEGLFMLIPNEEEADTLCPGMDSPEAQAQFLFDKGVENVIITLAAEGCLWLSRNGCIRFPAQPYPCVDSTGASDVFISCLAVMLSEGKSIANSIQAAICAASYSVAHEGVQGSIPDRLLLDTLIGK